MSPFLLVLLFFASLLAGALNSVAGGGSFLSFPALLFAGVPPVAANATNAVALWPAGIAAGVAYRKDLHVPRATLFALGGASLAGGLAGALLLLRTPDATFLRQLPWLLLVATVLFTFGPSLAKRLQREGGAGTGALVATALVQVVIGIYGGYFGGGMGILMLAAMSLLGMQEIHTMNGLKAVLGVLINGIAVVAFVIDGAVAWGPGLVMVVGGTLGGYAGATIARRLAPVWVRRFVLVVAWSMTGYFWYTSGMAAAATLLQTAPAPSEQRMLLHNVSWKEYVVLRDLLDGPALRMTYLAGDLELMRPSPEHELWKTNIARLLELFAHVKGVDLYGYGSTTFKREAKERGAEPDECYLVGKKLADVPEIVLEVIHTTPLRAARRELATSGVGLRAPRALRAARGHSAGAARVRGRDTAVRRPSVG